MAIGAYAVERDYSHYVAHAARTILAVVGTATKGPVGVATVCTSTQDLVNKFGPLKPDCLALYAGQYFLSQSSKLYFVRAAHTDNIKRDEDGNIEYDTDGKTPLTDGTKIATASRAILSGKGSNDSEIKDAITLEFYEVGTYGNNYSVVVTAGNPLADDTETYTISMKNMSGAVVESIKNIELDDLASGYTTEYFKVVAKNDSTAKLIVGTNTTPVIYNFTGGDDGIEDIEPADYINAAQALIPETVDMNLFAVPGVTDAEVVTAMLAIAENRGDCLYLVDPPKGLTRDGVANWHNGSGDYTHAAFNSSYGALYFDWVTIYDSINKQRVVVPPSVPVAASYAYSDRTSEVWYAPAGLTRGVVRGVLDSVTKLSKADVDYLYGGENNVNAIYDDPQVGLVLWGQKTLLRADTAMNRVNVRRLLNYLKRIVVAASSYLVFEPNDRVTWNSFEMMVTPVLEGIKNRRGIYEYRVVRGETIVTDNDIDNYRMPCMIMIRPAKAAEEIPIYFVLTSTGAEFNEVLEANGMVQV